MGDWETGREGSGSWLVDLFYAVCLVGWLVEAGLPGAARLADPCICQDLGFFFLIYVCVHAADIPLRAHPCNDLAAVHNAPSGRCAAWDLCVSDFDGTMAHWCLGNVYPRPCELHG